MQRAPSPEEQPEVSLSNWAILELEDGARFFMGDLDGHPGRIRTSTPIRMFDPATMTGVTQSGRIYHLRGEPRSNPTEDIAIQIAARVIGLDLSSVTVVEVDKPAHHYH